MARAGQWEVTTQPAPKGAVRRGRLHRAARARRGSTTCRTPAPVTWHVRSMGVPVSRGDGRTKCSTHEQQPRPDRVELFPPPSSDRLPAQVVRSGQDHPVDVGQKKDVQQSGERDGVRRFGPSIGEDAAELQLVLLAVLGEGHRQRCLPLGGRALQPQVPVDDRAVHIVLFGECPQGSRPYRGRDLLARSSSMTTPAPAGYDPLSHFRCTSVGPRYLCVLPWPWKGAVT